MFFGLQILSNYKKLEKYAYIRSGITPRYIPLIDIFISIIFGFFRNNFSILVRGSY